MLGGAGRTLRPFGSSFAKWYFVARTDNASRWGKRRCRALSIPNVATLVAPIIQAHPLTGTTAPPNLRLLITFHLIKALAHTHTLLLGNSSHRNLQTASFAISLQKASHVIQMSHNPFNNRIYIVSNTSTHLYSNPTRLRRHLQPPAPRSTLSKSISSTEIIPSEKTLRTLSNWSSSRLRFDGSLLWHSPTCRFRAR